MDDGSLTKTPPPSPPPFMDWPVGKSNQVVGKNPRCKLKEKPGSRRRAVGFLLNLIKDMLMLHVHGFRP